MFAKSTEHERDKGNVSSDRTKVICYFAGEDNFTDDLLLAG